MLSRTICGLAFSLMIMNSALASTPTASTSNSYSKQYMCVKANGVDNLYLPQCNPSHCAPEDRDRASFPCVIGNIEQSNPGTCEAAKKLLEEKQNEALISADPWSTGSGRDIDCYARLSSMELFALSCQNYHNLHEVSLSFSFRLPDCDLKTLRGSKAVMVNFNGKNDTNKNYFTNHPICRTFNYTGASFTEKDVGNFPSIPYDCLAVGLRHGYPYTYYYLGLTTLPDGRTVNYTIVFEEGDFMTDFSSDSSSTELVKDSKTKRLRLLAAASLPNQIVHVVFSPLEKVVTYQVELKSTEWSTTKNVTVAQIEMQNVPSGASVIQVKVTAIDSQVCSSGQCPTISVTLHKGGNNLGVPPPSAEPNPQPETSSVVLYTCIAVFSGIITSTVVLLVLRLGPNKGSRKTVLMIGEHTDRTGQVARDLNKHAHFIWIQGIPREELVEKLRSSDRIFVVLMSRMNRVSMEIYRTSMPYCLTDSTKDKTSVVLVDAFNKKPSTLLQCLELSQHCLNYLDDIKSFHWPQDRAKIIKCLSRRCKKITEPEIPLIEDMPCSAEGEEASSSEDSSVQELFGGHDTPEEATTLNMHRVEAFSHEEVSLGTPSWADSQTSLKKPFSLEVQRDSVPQSFSLTDSSIEVDRVGGVRIFRAAPMLQEPILYSGWNGRHVPEENSNEFSSPDMGAVQFSQVSPWERECLFHVHGSHFVSMGPAEAEYHDGYPTQTFADQMQHERQESHMHAESCHSQANNRLMILPGQSVDKPHHHFNFLGRTGDLPNHLYSQSADSGILHTPGSRQQSMFAPQIQSGENSNEGIGRNISRRNQIKSGQDLRWHYHDGSGVNSGGAGVNHGFAGVNHGFAGVNHGGAGVNHGNASVNHGDAGGDHECAEENFPGREGVGQPNVVNEWRDLPVRGDGEENLRMVRPSAGNVQIARRRQSPEENVDDVSLQVFDSGHFSLDS